jgi:hypothetical protein
MFYLDQYCLFLYFCSVLSIIDMKDRNDSWLCVELNSANISVWERKKGNCRVKEFRWILHCLQRGVGWAECRQVWDKGDLEPRTLEGPVVTRFWAWNLFKMSKRNVASGREDTAGKKGWRGLGPNSPPQFQFHFRLTQSPSVREPAQGRRKNPQVWVR